jgi:sugar-specific transcriptional regulator TrmB
MEDIIKFLKKLELSDVEAKLYLTLLQHGPTSVRELAETINIKRTTTYFYIDQLIEKGLIIKMVKGSKKQVAANPPESLQHLVEKKVASAKQVEQTFPDILKSLTTTLPHEDSNEGAEITYYKGKNGVRKIYEDVLRAKEQRSYVDISKIAEVFPENYHLFRDAFIQNPEIQMFEIIENSPESKIYLDNLNKYSGAGYHYKLLPEDTRLTAQDILIYDGKVAIIHLKDSISGVVLKNTDLYNNFKILFDFIWKSLP